MESVVGPLKVKRVTLATCEDTTLNAIPCYCCTPSWRKHCPGLELSFLCCSQKVSTYVSIFKQHLP